METNMSEGRYWGNNYVEPCPDCGVAPFNVDDCGHFGDPECPYFGIGKEEYEDRFKSQEVLKNCVTEFINWHNTKYGEPAPTKDIIKHLNHAKDAKPAKALQILAHLDDSGTIFYDFGVFFEGWCLRTY